MEKNKIYNENCLATMKNMADNSIDCVITDPPYGYSFMGKDWDKVVPSVEIWEECLRVLKPGAFAFIMSAPRQDVLSHMIINLDKAGFDTSFTSIYWTYASGFPKAMNIGKAVDKRLGVEQTIIGVKENETDLGKNTNELLGNARKQGTRHNLRPVQRKRNYVDSRPNDCKKLYRKRTRKRVF